MKKRWLETTKSRSLKIQLPTAYLLWLDRDRIESQLEKKITQLQSVFICSEPDHLQRLLEMKKIQQQQNEHQKNRNAKTTSKVPPEKLRGKIRCETFF